jgi:hypothetical protein
MALDQNRSGAMAVSNIKRVLHQWITPHLRPRLAYELVGSVPRRGVFQNEAFPGEPEVLPHGYGRGGRDDPAQRTRRLSQRRGIAVPGQVPGPTMHSEAARPARISCAYQTARREFFEQAGAVVGGRVLTVDADLKTVCGHEVIVPPTKKLVFLKVISHVGH